jgi:dTDP-4-amino-4,6-dideoxygalactose transaminase
MANNYNLAFKDIDDILIPKVHRSSSHVYHQYTLRILNGKRDKLKNYLNDLGIPSMIYYPIPIHKQKPYRNNQTLKNTDILSNEVISLPIHTELEKSNQDYIIDNFIKYFK